MMYTAAVAGATGLTGKLLLEKLERHPQFSRIFVPTRKQVKINSRKTELIITDFRDLNWKRAFPADVFFCCLGTTMKIAGSKEAFRAVDFTLVVELARLAKQKGCRQFIGICSIGANKNSSYFYLRAKGEMEAAVSELGFESCIFLRPSILLGPRHEQRTGEKMGIMLSKILSPIMAGPLRKYRGIESEKVATAMIKLALDEKPGISIVESDELQKIS